MHDRPLAAHVARVCKIEDIAVSSHSRGGRAWRKTRRIAIRPVKSAVTYAIALHEIGHILGPRQSGTRLDKEVGAWEWAKANAIEWTEPMESAMRSALQSYLAWSKRSRQAKQAAPGLDSYRCRGPYGWIMIGAKDDADALREAQRSNPACTRDGLEFWNAAEQRYAPVAPREYYVTMIRAKRTAFLLGPYRTHAEALAKVDEGRRLASKVDPWADFDAFGTSSLPLGSGVVGKLG